MTTNNAAATKAAIARELRSVARKLDSAAKNARAVGKRCAFKDTADWYAAYARGVDISADYCNRRASKLTAKTKGRK